MARAEPALSPIAAAAGRPAQVRPLRTVSTVLPSRALWQGTGDGGAGEGRMQGSQRKMVIAAFVVLFVVALVYFLSSGPHPETGKCVDRDGALVGCDARAARYKLARKVGSGRECPADYSKLYVFRGSKYCGVALHGAPVPRPDYVPCLLLAGAKLARSPHELVFAKGFAAPPPGDATSGRIKVRGDDWRIFYVLHEGQLDPGLAAVVARPGAVVFVAYITGAAAHRKEIAAATRCS